MVSSVLIELQSHFSNGRGVTADDFIKPLEIDSEDQIEYVRANGAPWMSGVVCFPITRLNVFVHETEPYELFEAGVHRAFLAAANFLDRRSIDVIEKMRAEAMSLKLFIDVRMDKNQMELVLPSELIVACSRHGLGIFVISNDISAAEALGKII